MDIFSYTDYRQFLRDFYNEQKSINPQRYSLRAMARWAGLKSHSYFKMIMDGSRNIAPKSIGRFGSVLKLKQKEKVYFQTLVMYNQAKSEDERDLYFKKLFSLKLTHRFHDIDKDTLKLLSHHYVLIIREMVALPHFNENPQWIANALGNKISPREAKDAIRTLLNLGLLQRNNAGRLVLAAGTLKSLPDLQSIEMVNIYNAAISQAKEALFKVPFEKREFLSLTIPLAEGMISHIKEILQKCTEEIAGYVNQIKDQNFNDVYQINLQMFPVSQTLTKETTSWNILFI